MIHQTLRCFLQLVTVSLLQGKAVEGVFADALTYVANKISGPLSTVPASSSNSSPAKFIENWSKCYRQLGELNNLNLSGILTEKRIYIGNGAILMTLKNLPHHPCHKTLYPLNSVGNGFQLSLSPIKLFTFRKRLCFFGTCTKPGVILIFFITESSVFLNHAKAVSLKNPNLDLLLIHNAWTHNKADREY